MVKPPPPDAAPPKKRPLYAHWWVWTCSMPAAVIMVSWMVWEASGPQRILPDGSVRLTRTTDNRWRLALHPDGRHLAFTVLTSSPSISELVILDLSTGTEQRVQTIGTHGFPMWLADASLACIIDNSFEAATESPALVLIRKGQESRIRLDPFVHVINASSDTATSNLYILGQMKRGEGRLGFPLLKWTLDPSQGSLKPDASWKLPGLSAFVPAPGGAGWVAQLAPNLGGRIVFYDQTRTKRGEVRPPDIRRAERTMLRAVSPDGRRAACIVWRDSARGEFLQRLRLRATAHRRRNPPDSVISTLTSLRNSSQTATIAIADSSQGRFIELATFKPSTVDVAWHPDGKHLIAQGDGHLWLIPLPQYLWSQPTPGWKDSPK